MISFGSALAPVLEHPSSSHIRRRLTLWRAGREAAGTALSADRRNVLVLKESELARPDSFDRSPELFILGSGPSVLDLTPTQMARMRSGTTIGLNSWALHDFIPDAYSFEEMSDDRYIPVAQGLSAVLARPEVVTSQPLVLHLRARLSTPSRRLISLPPGLQPNMRYYGRVTVETKRKQNLVGDLTALVEAHCSRALPPQLLIDSGMSVARMVSLGILRGYSSIVLVGIDLNSSRYFFEEESSYLTRHNLQRFNPAIDRSKDHDTEKTANRNFAASDFLPALADAAQIAQGVKIFVGSPASKLAKNLPQFPW